MLCKVFIEASKKGSGGIKHQMGLKNLAGLLMQNWGPPTPLHTGTCRVHGVAQTYLTIAFFSSECILTFEGHSVFCQTYWRVLYYVP